MLTDAETQAVGQARREVDENGDVLPAKIRLYDAEMVSYADGS
jgi:hypothetical protein